MVSGTLRANERTGKRMVELMVGKAGVNGGPGFVSLDYSFARMADLGRNALIASSRVSR